MIHVKMPQLGESVAEGTITKWHVAVGTVVKREQTLLDVATDKADTEVPSPVDGVITELRFPEGSVVETGGVLCVIQEGASAEAAPPPPLAKPVDESKSALSSPSTRKLAREHGVDIAAVQPTGEHGRVTHADVQRAAAPPTQTLEASIPKSPIATSTGTTVELSRLVQEGGGFVPPIPGVGFGSYKVPPYHPKPGDQVVPFSRRRRITADHMVYSKLTSPHVVTVAEVDLHETSVIREAHKAQFKKEGVGLTFLAFICAATVRALRENPTVNARVLDNSYALLKDINLGVAVDTPGGLLVPSVKQADQLSLRGIASAIDELATRARAGKITADDLSGTSFSVSNPGLKGNLFGGAIISQPNVGILRMGEIKKRVVVVSRGAEDTIAIHPVMYMALSYDHRVIDGVAANAFLWRVADILSRGEFEV